MFFVNTILPNCYDIYQLGNILKVGDCITTVLKVYISMFIRYDLCLCLLLAVRVLICVSLCLLMTVRVLISYYSVNLTIFNNYLTY